MSAARERQPSRFESVHVGLAGALFTFAMGLSTVAIPLFALSTGYNAGEVGLLVALSACAQLGVRSVMGILMRHAAPKYFVVVSGVLMSLSCLVLVASAELWAFVCSQLAQGAARGFFWTGAHTHVVRTSKSSVAAIARINLTSGVGQILGPLLAGPAIQHLSVAWTLSCAGIIGALAVLPSSFMVWLSPLRPEKKRGAARSARRRSGVGMASWAGASAGSWRAMMNSYVPVVLAETGHAASAIGVVVAVANSMSIAGGAGAGWIRTRQLRLSLIVGMATAGVGLAMFGLLAGDLMAAAGVLAVSGLGAGLLQTVGPALASETVSHEARGEAIATAGTYRAGALLLTPLGVAGLLTVMATSAAVAITGLLMVSPVVLNRGRDETSD